MTRLYPAFALAVGIALACGCGTICNFASGDPEPYGGVATDINVLKAPLNLGQGSGQGGGEAALIFLGIWLADFCTCWVTDTLTLPLVYYWHNMPRESWLPKVAYADEEIATPPRFTAGAAVAPDPPPP